MREIRIKANAKVNFTLNILGINSGFHMLDTIVASVDIADVISLVKRDDNLITFKGNMFGGDDNNAVKSAKLFQEKFSTCGVDIILQKKIPFSSGLGGSSSDIAGVLVGMKNLFSVDESVKDIADTLGSDSGYMLSGGFSRLFGKGDIVKNIDSGMKIKLLVVKGNGGISSKWSFKRFDELNGIGVLKEKSENSELAQKAIENEDIDLLAKNLHNDLFFNDDKFNVMKEIMREISRLGGIGSVMTGSGNAVIGLFGSEEKLEKANGILGRKYWTTIARTTSRSVEIF